MSKLKLVWVISRDKTLQHRLHDEVNVIQVEHSDDLVRKSSRPSAVIFDPDQRSTEILHHELGKIVNQAAGAPVIVLSNETDKKVVLTMFHNGAFGYLLKSESDRRIQEAMVDLVEGGAPLSSFISKLLVEPLRPKKPFQGKAWDLKDREVALLQHLSEGMTKKDISEKYNQSIHTIDNHVRQIYFKMQVNNLGQAVGDAFRNGIIS